MTPSEHVEEVMKFLEESTKDTFKTKDSEDESEPKDNN